MRGPRNKEGIRTLARADRWAIPGLVVLWGEAHVGYSTLVMGEGRGEGSLCRGEHGMSKDRRVLQLSGQAISFRQTFKIHSSISSFQTARGKQESKKIEPYLCDSFDSHGREQRKNTLTLRIGAPHFGHAGSVWSSPFS